MGRRKISIQPITDERNRKVTFVKRKAGLFKKAHELAILCQVDLAVIILGNNNNKFYEYTSTNVDDLLVAFNDNRYSHDVKTPAEYGDYSVESRVKSTLRSHQRNTSSVSFSIEENDNENSSEEDDDDDDEDDDSKAPPPKRRKTRGRNTASNDQTSIKTESVSQGSVASSHSAQYVPASTPQYPTSQLSQQQQIQLQQHHHQLQHQQHHQQVPPQLPPTQSWGQPPPNTSVDTVQPSQVPPGYSQYQMHHLQQQQYQFPMPGNFNASPLQQRQAALPQQSQSVPTVQNSQPPAQNSPYMNSRARSLNNGISTRPILRVEIPSDPTRPAQGTKPGDSALTVTALDTGKNESADKSSSGPKTSGDKTPQSAKSGEELRPALGVLSNNSTPVSATLPSGLFNLPPPQPNPHFHHNNGGYKPMVAGEQTPLTAGLPSRYVPELFPSPSNFYSSEWNIPFGSGNTPYPSSAGPHILPLPGSSNLSTNAKIRKHTILNTDPVDSPLVNLQKEREPKEERMKPPGDDLEAKKIKFEERKKGEYKRG